jgi:hypothetical protein
MPPGRILRTPDAVTDLDHIWDHIAADNPLAADRMLDELNIGSLYWQVIRISENCKRNWPMVHIGDSRFAIT